MGQYYRMVNLTKKQAIEPFQTGNLNKLMESCYVYNSFILEILIKLTNEWKGDSLVHSGDYSDDADKEWDEGLYPKTQELHLFYDNERGYIAELTEYGQKLNRTFWDIILAEYVLVNYDKKIYCRLDCCRVDKGDYQICPLTLLLANSNGLGGGDYRPNDEEDGKHVGSWQYDHIGVEEEISVELEDMQLVAYDFYEE